jgi:hypothetical protein
VDWLSNNWKLLFEGVGGTAAVAIIGYVCKLLFWPQSSGQDASLTAQGARVSESPVASGSDIVQTVGGTHHYYYSLAVAQPSAIDPASEPKQQNIESASLSPLSAQEVYLDQNSGVWLRASANFDTADRAIVLPFKNVPNPQGQRTSRANAVSSRLVFKNAHNSDETHVNHGVWLGHFQYAATFNSGVTHELLVALKGVPFVTFENPNAHNPFAQRRRRSGMSISSPQKKPVWNIGTVEIVLVDSHNVTMFHGMFDYEFTAAKMTLAPKK